MIKYIGRYSEKSFFGGVGMIIRRTEYLDRLHAVRNQQTVKIITGVYRCGKTIILDQYREDLRRNGVDEAQIIAIDFNKPENEYLRDYRKLYAFLKEHLVSGEKTYLFLDEVQQVSQFAIIVFGLYSMKNIDLYISGSTEFLKKSVLQKMPEGSCVSIRVLPFSYNEYLDCTGHEFNKDQIMEYVESTTFPGAIMDQIKSEEMSDYLKGIFYTTVVQNIVTQKKITDVEMVEQVLKFLYCHIGEYLSSKKIADRMTMEGNKIDTKTVEKYLEALSDICLIYRVKRYDLKGKQILKTLEKIYVTDFGMKDILFGSVAIERKRLFENMVCLELLRRGYEVYAGKSGSDKIDFVAEKNGIFSYFQAAICEDEIKNKLKPLQGIREEAEKTVIVYEPSSMDLPAGIQNLFFSSWLAKDIEGEE